MLPLYLIGTAAVTENLLKRKWSTVILRHLDSGLYDPAEICQLEPDLTPLAINERLRTMQRYSLVTRYPRHGAKKIIEYRLTPRGQKILKMLTLIEQLDEVSDKSQIVLPDEKAAPEAQAVAKPSVNKSPRKKTRGNPAK
jgi:DNA-binding HxlR family transcriptional regulator